MKRLRTVVLSVVGLALAAGIGWFLWTHFRPRLYGSVGEYMKTLEKLHGATGAAVARGGPLPPDMEEMTRLRLMAQDIVVVFGDDPRSADPRFSAAATALMRGGANLQRAWNEGKADEARAALSSMAQACNECHAALSDGKGPTMK